MDGWMHGCMDICINMYKYLYIYIYIHIYVCHKSEFVALEKKIVLLVTGVVTWWVALTL